MAGRPNWLNTAIFYEIYPQSFNDTNADGIGDIQGIIEKLDYIKELGCNALWLNPCFQSPFYDAGYDVEDYFTVAPRYGTNEDLVRLFQEAHKRDMHVLLDLVPGHTSVNHKWFRESMKAEKNAYTDRYVWTDSTWEAPDGMNALKGISERVGACGVNFFSHQPALNYGYYKPDPEKKWQQAMDAPGPLATREAMKEVMRFWLQAGCDGFRVDMAGSLVKNDEDSKGTIGLWQDIRAFLDQEFPAAVMVSEWGEPDKSLAGGFHMDFLLHFGPSHYNDLFRCEEPWFSRRGKGEIGAFWEKYKESYEKSCGGLICIPSGNHDMDRLARRLDKEEMKLAFAFLLTMPGAPFIYYGDEIGMRYVEDLHSVEGGYERTGSRSPMQWDASLNAGFSAAKPDMLYVAQDSASDRPTVEAQIGDADSLYSEVKRLIAFRQSHEALRNDGEIEFLQEENYPLAFVRKTENERLLVIINPSDRKQPLSVDVKPGEALYTIGGKLEGAEGGFAAAPCSAGIYRI